MSVLDFKKKHDHIVCIDSDGCAMDTMNIKHIRCFGPCMVKEWELSEWEQKILERWNEINLYSLTRGINRFKGLSMALSEINEKYRKIDGVEELRVWSETAPELSNSALVSKIGTSPVFEKALNWSRSVNEEIEKLPQEEIKPFEGVKEAFSLIHESADIAVVSSANPEAVRKEWERFGLLEMVDVICTQEVGSKSACIKMISEKGYEKDHILMVGDAPGDRKAAEENEVLFYPILVKHEAESWAEFRTTALDKFLKLSYEDYGEEKKSQFESNLME